MNAKRTEPRVHAFVRPINGAYVPAAGTTTDHLRAVFDAERARIEREAKPRRRRRRAPPALQSNPTQLQLVA